MPIKQNGAEKIPDLPRLKKCHLLVPHLNGDQYHSCNGKQKLKTFGNVASLAIVQVIEIEN